MNQSISENKYSEMPRIEHGVAGWEARMLPLSFATPLLLSFLPGAGDEIKNGFKIFWWIVSRKARHKSCSKDFQLKNVYSVLVSVTLLGQ